MIKRNINDFWRGWFIGDFEPSLLKTKDFEVAVLTHTKGEHWPAHYHAVATEYNLLLSGRMIICGQTIEAGDIFVLEPNEVADPEFLEDCKVVCIKTPSVKGDKYEVLSK